MDRNNIIPIIKILQRCALNVLFIDDTYFVVHEFLPAEDSIGMHTVTGIDVTEIVHNHTAVNFTDVTLQKKIEKLIKQMGDTEVETQKFSANYSWRWFFSVKNYK